MKRKRILLILVLIALTGNINIIKVNGFDPGVVSLLVRLK